MATKDERDLELGGTAAKDEELLEYADSDSEELLEDADSDSDSDFDEEEYLKEELALLKRYEPDVFKDVVDLGEFRRDMYAGSIFMGESEIFVPRRLVSNVLFMIDESKEKNKNILLVSYLPFHQRNSDSLLKIFKPFGDVISATVFPDPESKCLVNYGFVDFHKREEAQIALHKLNQHGIKGYDVGHLKVEWAADIPIIFWTPQWKI